MTIEELEIIVTAKVEEALKEFKKFAPTVKKMVQDTQNAMQKMDTNVIKNKVSKAVQEIKNKISSLKKSNKDNNIKLIVNNEEAKKQVTQLEKEIESLQKKITSREMQLQITNNAIDKTKYETRSQIQSQNPNLSATQINNRADLKLDGDSGYNALIKQSDRLNTEVMKYTALLDSAKNKLASLKEEVGQTATSQSKLASFFSSFKNKLDQAKTSAKGLGASFKKLPNLTQSVSNSIKKWGSNIKSGAKSIAKTALALFSLRGVYSILSNCASSWLSSQNAGAQQLSANIEYMKYAMGTALAPVIQYVTNLVYQLMKAIQSVAYALTGVNIFAKASASSYSSMASSASKAKKETQGLAGVHNEINNVQTQDNSNSGGGASSPSFDLSKMENTSNSIIDAIKNGNWYEVGATIAKKINEAMDKIPWDTIHSKASQVGKNIADFINGGVQNTNWDKVGNTVAQGINTAIYFAKSLINNTNFSDLGQAIGTTIASTIKNIDWENFWQTLVDAITGLVETLNGILIDTDYSEAQDSFINGLFNIDLSKLSKALFRLIGWILGETIVLLSGIKLYEYIYKYLIEPSIENAKEDGGNIILGLLKGLGNAILGIGQWIYDNILKPFLDGFKEAFGIHSPSKVMEEQGTFIIQGLLNGISSLVGKISEVWQKMKNTAVQKFSDMKTSITNKVQEIKNGITSKFQEAYNNIKNTFNRLGSFFSGIWGGIKNTFSNLGTSIGNAISNAVKSGINGVISLIQNTINRAIRIINGAIYAINLLPGVNVSSISQLYLPRLAKGNVATSETLAIFGEYSNARSNPEITTPQNIMRETFEDVLSNYNGGNGQPLRVQVYFGAKEIINEVIDGINEKTRQTGKAQIKVCYE